MAPGRTGFARSGSAQTCTVFLRMGDNGFISESGRQNWAEGHIPWRRFRGSETRTSVDASSRLRYALPAAREFADAMQRLGVSDDSRVGVVRRQPGHVGCTRVVDVALDRLRQRGTARRRPSGLESGKPAGYHGVRRSGRRHVDGCTSVLRSSPTKPMYLLRSMMDQRCLIDALSPASFSGEVNAYGSARAYPRREQRFGYRVA